MRDATYQRKRRAAARKRGMCTSCATKRPEPGFKCCASCRARYLNRGKERINPGRIAPPVAWCDECLVVLVDGRHRPGCGTTGTSQAFRRVP